MVSNPNEVPPPFRSKHQPPSFIGMDDDQVLKIAANALQCAAVLPINSPARAAQWDRFDSAMAELSGRAVRHALRKVHEIHESFDEERGLEKLRQKIRGHNEHGKPTGNDA